MAGWTFVLLNPILETMVANDEIKMHKKMGTIEQYEVS